METETQRNIYHREKMAMEGASNLRSELIERIKREIRDKTYRIKSQEIADKIAQKLREDEAYTITLHKKNRWTP